MDRFDVCGIASELETLVERELVESGAVLVGADKVGLDYRAGRVYVTSNAIICVGSTRALEYYGGFEYVERELVFEFGDYTVYCDDCERVLECIEYYNENCAAEA